MVAGDSEHQRGADGSGNCLRRRPRLPPRLRRLRQLRAAEPVLEASREQLQAFREYGESWYLSAKDLESRFPPREPLARQPQVSVEAGGVRTEGGSSPHYTLCIPSALLSRYAPCPNLQVEVQPPTMEELLAHCSGAFSRQQLRNLECIVLRRLNFDLAAPTLSFFLEYFNLVRLEAPRADVREAVDARSLAVGIAGLSLADYAFINYAPSLLAAGSLGLADRLLQHRRPANLEVSGYPEELLQDCMTQLQLLVSLNEDSLSALLPWEVAQKCPWRQGSC
ncbi:CCNO protein, partial [Indicator maculatus]|nr:CCNO protein [Indicator maculatus]